MEMDILELRQLITKLLEAGNCGNLKPNYSFEKKNATFVFMTLSTLPDDFF